MTRAERKIRMLAKNEFEGLDLLPAKKHVSAKVHETTSEVGCVFFAF